MATLPADRRGWIVGHFVDALDLLSTNAVEVKWGVHPADERRSAYVPGDVRTALAILVSGRFRIWLPDGSSVMMSEPGDYVMWGPGVGHTWEAVQDSVVVTVRWPSIPGDLGDGPTK